MDMDKYRNTLQFSRESVAWDAYRAENSRLKELFFCDLCEEYAIPRDKDQTQRMLDYAWEQGHASGYGEVEGVFEDIVYLVYGPGL